MLAPDPPDRPPWVKDDPSLPPPSGGWVRGELLEWRMEDPDARTWKGLVRYSDGGLAYELWLPGERIKAIAE